VTDAQDLPAEAFVGALLHLPAERVIRLARVVGDGDLFDPKLDLVRRLAVELAERGVAPDPAAVSAHARSTGSVSAANVAQLTALLVDLHTGCPIPGQADVYAAAVVEEAVRRRVREAAVRLTQAAADVGVHRLVEIVTAESQAMHAATARLPRRLASVDATPGGAA
jgi:replicative DNA helicase